MGGLIGDVELSTGARKGALPSARFACPGGSLGHACHSDFTQPLSVSATFANTPHRGFDGPRQLHCDRRGYDEIYNSSGCIVRGIGGSSERPINW